MILNFVEAVALGLLERANISCDSDSKLTTESYCTVVGGDGAEAGRWDGAGGVDRAVGRDLVLDGARSGWGAGDKRFLHHGWKSVSDLTWLTVSDVDGDNTGGDVGGVAKLSRTRRVEDVVFIVDLVFIL